MNSFRPRFYLIPVEKEKIDEFLATFKEAVGPEKQLNREAFSRCCKHLEKLGLRIADTPFEERLFCLLDKDKSGSIDAQEFLEGMAVIVKGTPEEKLRLTFRAYDLNGDDQISKEELVEIFKQAWLTGLCVLLSTNEMGEDEDSKAKTAKEMEDFSHELSQKFAEKAFSHLDKNNDGFLSFEEFKEFAQQDPKITTTLNGFKKEIRITLMALSDVTSPKPAAR